MASPSSLFSMSRMQNLDGAAERSLTAVIGKLKKRGTSVIVMGHRPSTTMADLLGKRSLLRPVVGFGDQHLF
jgi:hypothetical protein